MVPTLSAHRLSVRLDALLCLLLLQASRAVAEVSFQGDTTEHHYAQLRGSMRGNSAMQGAGLSGLHGNQRHRCRTIKTVLPEGSLLPHTLCTPPGSTDCRASVNEQTRSNMFAGRAREDLGEEVFDMDRPSGALQGRTRMPYLVPQRRDASTAGAVTRLKAQVLNQFVLYNKISSVVEIGYSYGHEGFQELLNVPLYKGYDTSIDLWRFYYERFQGDFTKQFFHYEGSLPETATAELCISLGVIPKLETRYEVSNHLRSLFKCSSKYIAIFSSNFDAEGMEAMHIKHHKFTNWVDYQFGDSWRLLASLPNRYPMQSPYDFYFYKNTNWEKDCGVQPNAEHDEEEGERFKYWITGSAAQHSAKSGTILNIHSGTQMSLNARKQQLGISNSIQNVGMSRTGAGYRSPISRNYNHYGNYGHNPVFAHVPSHRLHYSQVQRANAQYGKRR